MELRKREWVAALAAIAAPMMAEAQTQSSNETVRLPDVEVYGEAAETERFLPDTEGTKIYAGKKTSVVESDSAPPVINNNLRQEFSQVPGLLVAEMPIPSQANVNYRGVGDPHESEYLLQLKDGVPFVSDWFGYSTVYYVPPLESVARVEFIRGGAALLYGPQPGPVLNYVTYRPPLDKPFTASTLQIGGSYDLYSTYNQVGGTVDRIGYLGYYHHRQADGPRDNSDYTVNTGGFKLLLDAVKEVRWIFDFYAFGSESGEAGRLSLAQYNANRDFTRTPDDRIWIERYAPCLTYERDLSEQTSVEVKMWGGFQDRFSRRQNSAGTAANLDRQEFNFGGLDGRLRHNYEAWDNDHTFSGGAVTYVSSSPRSRELGTPRTATTGTPVFEMDRHTYYGALFGENLFKFGRLGVIPAFRLELVAIDAKENFNTSLTTRGLINEDSFSVVPLGAMGLTFDLTEKNQVYANFSTAYRPKEYDDLANPTSNTQLPPAALDESYVFQYEVGVRGVPTTWFSYDTSLFHIDYDNLIETQLIPPSTTDTERSNSGRAQYFGWEAGVETDIIGIIDALTDSKHGEKFGKLSVYGNTSVLTAEFVEGANKRKEPAYAPTYTVKAGPIYRLRDRVKIAMQGQFVGAHSWQDNNNDSKVPVGTRNVPSYAVWDLTGEVAVWKNLVTIVAGINNVFDREYFSRVRTDGIEPAFERNFYAGVKITWP